ncbi:MAG TPA: hypothetical protein VFF60_08440 [Candidatus Binatus sp.]|nr:hypothetical protein [Candidatus Binatus sp.]
MLRFLVATALVFSWISAAHAAETSQALIARALSAAPEFVRAGAAVITVDEHGKQTVLRQGTNGYTCLPGTPGVIGDDPMCMDAQAQLWVKSLIAHAPKPANTAPGIIYMQAGGTDASVTDPFAATTSGQPFRDPPHWMIMWPFDPKTTGLPAHWSDSGTWIMFPGTPYAHLMIVQKL